MMIRVCGPYIFGINSGEIAQSSKGKILFNLKISLLSKTCEVDCTLCYLYGGFTGIIKEIIIKLLSVFLRKRAPYCPGEHSIKAFSNACDTPRGTSGIVA